MDKSRLLNFLKNKIDTNEEIIYDKLVLVNDISHKMLQQKHDEWNEWDFSHLFNHIKHINKKVAYIKQIYDVINATNGGILE